MTGSATSPPAEATPSTSYYATCPPLRATPRRPERPTTGWRAANVARALGVRLDDWQRGILDTAGELLPDGVRHAYPVVVLVVPRRAGKTFAVLLAMLGVLLAGAGRRCWYTLHRREIGAALWRDEWFPLLDGSRLRPLLQLRRSNGSEAITVRRLHSVLRLFAPSGEALRSQNADVVVVDEAREFELENGEALEAAARPAFLRRRGRQLWIISSAGGPQSTWLRKYRDLGRAAVDAGADTGIAYFEWGAPTDLPYDDPATWVLGHPALAAGTIEPEALAADLATMSRETFGMEYLGWWVDDAGGALVVVDPERWAAAGTAGARVSLEQLPGWWVALDIASDRSSAAVAVAARRGDSVHVEAVAVGPGATWARQTALELLGRRRGGRLVIDGYGPAANVAELLRAELGERLEELSTADAAKSLATLLDLLADGRLTHRAQPELAAITAGRARRYGTDGWLWDRSTVTPAITAATAAAGAAALHPPGAPPAIGRAR